MQATSSARLQSSFELLITLSVGLAVLLPVVVLAFVQLSTATNSLSSVEAQQAASKMASIATLVGSEGPPAKQLIEITVPTGVRYIYVGSSGNGVGHEIIFAVTSPRGLSYVTAYTPVNVSGSLGGLSSTGTYLVNVSAELQCPGQESVSCVYISPVV